jgi:hypothetical protein
LAIKEFEVHSIRNNDSELYGSFKDNLGKNYDLTLVLHKAEERISLRIHGNLLYASQDFLIKSKDEDYLLYYTKDSFRIERSDSLSDIIKKKSKSKRDFQM